jgi:hypothetical protein
MLANHAPASNDSPQGDSDYEIILTALLDTARGRLFLQEYLRRNRSADTATLLTAITRIEGLLTTRSLEASSPAPEAMDGEAPDASPAEAVIAVSSADTIDSTAEAVAQTETISVEVSLIETVSANVAETDTFSAEVVEVQADAVEFLGPQLAGAAVPIETVSTLARTTRAPRYPFADFRALSAEEKIALFT